MSSTLIRSTSSSGFCGGVPLTKPVAVVSASTAGIGLEVAHELARDGFHVVISSRRADNVALGVQQVQSRYGIGSASGKACNVSKKEERDALFAHAIRLREDGKVQALVLNAASSTHYGSILDVGESHWDKMFDVNVKSNFLLVQQFAPHFVPGSSVVFVSSIAAYNTLPGAGVYAVTKTALLGLTKVLALEMAQNQIRVNCVAPGIIKTNFSRKLWDGKNSLANSSTSDNSGRGTKLYHVPLRRIGRPEDISSVVAFLISEKASFITGETIVVAGGAMSRL